MKNLLDLLQNANAIQIDDIFVRYFHLEIEECEDDDNIVLHIEAEMDYNNYEYFFTKKELEDAVKYPDIDGWKVRGNANGCEDVIQIVPYKLTELKA